MATLAGEKTLHWRVNCHCNRRCPFCYGPQQKHEVKFEEAAPVIARTRRPRRPGASS